MGKTGKDRLMYERCTGRGSELGEEKEDSYGEEMNHATAQVHFILFFSEAPHVRSFGSHQKKGFEI